MGKITTKMEISEDVYLSLSIIGYSKQRISSEAKTLFAAYLFQKNLLSLGKAAELAELKLGQFISFLNELEIPVIDYEEDELDAEFETAMELSES